LQATRAAATQAGAQASERRQGLALAGIAPGKLGGPLALLSPIDGVVLDQSVQLGQRVESSAPLYRIAQLSPLWLEIQAPLAVAAGLREGMALRLAGSDLSGKLIAIGRAVDAASQTVLLRASIARGAETLTPGQVVEVELPAATGSAGSSQRLPTSALIRHDGQTFVFVQIAGDAEGSRFEARPLRLISQGGETAVADGVKAGERIAVKGVSGLKAMLTGVGKE
jgi:multidrug efflux pump subunit AcrA (membrane-fusion protein)